MPDREGEIISRFQRGDRSVFCDLVDMHKERVYAVAYSWLRNRADALDITQDAFLRLYGFLPRWRRRARLSTWLYRITVNLCIDLARKRGRERKGRERCAEEPVELPSLRREVEKRDLADMMRSAVDDLPPRQKTVIVLRHYRGLPLKEIARILKCPVGTVKANLYFALRSLRNRLERRGVSREAGGA